MEKPHQTSDLLLTLLFGSTVLGRLLQFLQMRLQRRTDLVSDLAHRSVLGRSLERLHRFGRLIDRQLLDLDLFLLLLRLLRSHVAVLRLRAAFDVEELREIDRLLLTARPDLVGIVEVWQARMVGARLIVVGLLVVPRVAASVVALKRHFGGRVDWF